MTDRQTFCLDGRLAGAQLQLVGTPLGDRIVLKAHNGQELEMPLFVLAWAAVSCWSTREALLAAARIQSVNGKPVQSMN